MITFPLPGCLLEGDDGTTQIIRTAQGGIIELSGQHRVDAPVGERGTLTIFWPGFSQKTEWERMASIDTPGDPIADTNLRKENDNG